MKRAVVILSVLSLLILAYALPASAAQPAHRAVFPDLIPLPDGFQPEGIVTGRGPVAFVGSLATGAIYRANLLTGEGEILVSPEDERTAVGLAFDWRTNYIYASGGGLGTAYVYDARTGDSVATYQLTDPGTFVNDAVVTRSAVYFTDSFRPVLYKIPLLPGGRLPDQDAVEEIALGGDFNFVSGEFNTNGIDATPNGKTLIIVNSTQGALYTVDPDTGEATLIDLGGESVPNGDGILLDGRTLYVVQNRLNQIAVVELSPNLSAGTITDVITDPDFRVPTTVAEFGKWLYAVNARFGETGPDLEYNIVRVRK